TAVQGQSDLREAIRQYEALLDLIISNLSTSKEREDACAVLARMKAADRAFSDLEADVPTTQQPTSATRSDTSSPRQSLFQAERFLGEVSDVRFFNLVKQAIQTQVGSANLNQDVDSYEQDGDIASPNVRPSGAVKLPSPEKTAAFTDVYFSTVHLAFPFIPRNLFMRSLDQARSSSDDATLDNTRLALISVCRTDSCWVTLGQTVRMAQSIGLHTEQRDSKWPKGLGKPLVERRRRVWYCIYVLDRLVSLQLGRPPAIHEDYCNVSLPSRLGDSDIDWDGDDIPANFTGPSAGDYHIALISFSDIISQVLRDLYSPSATQNLAEELPKTKELDRQLLQWKSSLPRPLRFDLGHTFEKSFIFKRQRSMFAIKYHHLRALIHRPYLCYPVLRNLDDNTGVSFTQINWPLVNMYEKTYLVQDFPWWQMISCLIFAGSILVVSSIFTQHTENTSDGLEAASTSDDAETCLRAFEALSTNSNGARMILWLRG
ncbi:fungal-specific transcription factor domain-containing protein, partial [Leptodontidium sp. 2 PMI_412]